MIGKVNKLITRFNWWECDFELDPGQNELEVGSPVSVGLQTLGIGSGVPFITEVSVVQRGAVKGAVFRNRRLLPPTAIPEPPKPIAASTPTLVAAPPLPVITRNQITEQADAEYAELNRRLDWLERHTGRPADTEAVIVGMQRELNGPSLDDLAREYRRPLGQVLGVR